MRVSPLIDSSEAQMVAYLAAASCPLGIWEECYWIFHLLREIGNYLFNWNSLSFRW